MLERILKLMYANGFLIGQVEYFLTELVKDPELDIEIKNNVEFLLDEIDELNDFVETISFRDVI